MSQMGTLLDRVPPQNLEAEQSTLGSMMIDRAALDRGVEILRPDDFYRDAHQIVFGALLSLAERNEPVDIVTCQEELRTRNRLEDVGGTEYLMALIDSVPTAANIEYYAHIVEEKAILRKLIDAGTQIVSLSHGAVDDVDALVGDCEQMVFRVAQKHAGEYFTSLSSLAGAGFEAIEAAYKAKRSVTGLATGFTDLDNLTGGLQERPDNRGGAAEHGEDGAGMRHRAARGDPGRDAGGDILARDEQGAARAPDDLLRVAD
jgi:replicative DNA helicase